MSPEQFARLKNELEESFEGARNAGRPMLRANLERGAASTAALRSSRHFGALSTFRFLAPVRRMIPPLGGTLDLSPLIVIVVAQLALMLPVRWLESAVIALFR